MKCSQCFVKQIITSSAQAIKLKEFEMERVPHKQFIMPNRKRTKMTAPSILPVRIRFPPSFLIVHRAIDANKCQSPRPIYTNSAIFLIYTNKQMAKMK